MSFNPTPYETSDGLILGSQISAELGGIPQPANLAEARAINSSVFSNQYAANTFWQWTNSDISSYILDNTEYGVAFAPTGEDGSTGGWLDTRHYIFPDQCGNDFSLLFRLAALLGKTAYIPKGTYNIDFVDVTLNDHLKVICHPQANIVGTDTKQVFTGAGDTFVLTEFTLDPFGVVKPIFAVVKDSGGTVTATLEPGAGMSFAGTTITLDSAIGATDTLTVVSAHPIIRIRGQNKTQKVEWRGGYINNSARGYVESKGTGSALAFNNFRKVTVEELEVYGSTDHETSIANGVSDSGLTYTECDHTVTDKCRFQGQADLGIYITGGGSTGTSDDGKNHRVTNSVFYRCNGAASSKRGAKGVTYSHLWVEECYTGVSTYEASTILPPGQLPIVSNCHFIKTGKRAIDLRWNMGKVHDNIILDIGRELDGTTLITSPTAMLFSGCEKIDVHDNLIAAVDWTGDTHAVGITLAEKTINSVQRISRHAYIHDNHFKDIYKAIRESGSASEHVGAKYLRNIMESVNTPHDGFGANTTSRWSYYLADQTELIEGVGQNPFASTTAVPTMTFATPGDLSVGSLSSSASYERKGNVVHYTLSVQASLTFTTASGEFRIDTNFPFLAENTSFLWRSTVQFTNSNVNWGTGKVLHAEMVSNSDQMRIYSDDTLATRDILAATDFTSGQTVRFDITGYYRCA